MQPDEPSDINVPDLTVLPSPSPLFKLGMPILSLALIFFGVAMMLDPDEPSDSAWRAASGLAFGLLMLWFWVEMVILRRPSIHLYSDRIVMRLWIGRTQCIYLTKYGMVSFSESEIGVKQRHLCFFNITKTQSLHASKSNDVPDAITADLTIAVTAIFGKRTISGADFAKAVQSHLDRLQTASPVSALPRASLDVIVRDHRRRKAIRTGLIAASPIATAGLGALTMEEPPWTLISIILLASGLIYCCVYWWNERRSRD
jgi:hypothetical protein